MSIFGKILNRFGYVEKQIRREQLERFGQRVYQAALVDRSTSNWINISSAIDADIKSGLRRVRDRARDASINDDYARGFLIRSRANIPGAEGFTLQMRIMKPDGTPDNFANELVENKYSEWCKKQYCTMQGMLHFIRVQWLETIHLKRDGEFILRKVYGPKVNKFGFSLDLMDPDDLDETYNTVLSNGNIVKMGVELDRWRKPVAFWIKKVSPEGYLNNSKSFERERVPAEDILFDFDPEFSKQTRGMSHMAQSLLRLRGVREWEKDSLNNAEAASKKLGFIIRKAVDGAEIEEDDTDEEGNPILEFKSMSINELPYGREFQSYDPKYPHEQHTPFLKSQLRGVAAGLGVSYNTLANDLEGVNFSSMRSGLLDERDNWQVNQVLLRESLLIPVFEEWLKWAIIMGELPFSYLDYDYYNKPEFSGRTWPWVDPKNDIEAAILEIEYGLNSRTRINKKNGRDTKDIINELKQELKEAGDLNISGKNTASTPAPANDDKNTGDENQDNSKRNKVFNLV